NKQQDKSKGGAFGQLFDSTGAPVGAEFRANSYTTNEQQAPRAGVDAAGNFVVVWTSYGGQDGYERGIFGQRYASDGTPRGGEFLVNAFTTGRQDGAAIAMNAAGDFVVAWQTAPDLSYLDIVARRFGADGTPFGTEIPVNSYTFRVQEKPAVALDAGGRFVVVWDTKYRDGSEEAIMAQRFCPPLSAVTVTTSGFTSVCPGGTGGTATATDSYGGPATHQWQYRPTGGMSYTNIPGATGSTYVIQANDFAGGAFGTYDLVCTTSPQCGSAITSAPVTITVANDTTPPSVAPPAAATATQTLCQ
ncbi:MAG TPA: hypothetical protein VGR00_09820, partial [Thermoanaerobaculia bacterium]|nr:hypothetical protein [Thermoanaerobaculia bacterium]